MGKETFADAIKRHLSDYKENVLNIDDDGSFRGNPYNHILPDGSLEANFIDMIFFPQSMAIKKTLKKLPLMSQKYGSPIKLHSYCHHLNSSQVMCINFFAPLLASSSNEKLLLDLLAAKANISLAEDQIAEGTFEYVSQGLTSDQAHPVLVEGTNFDFYLETKLGAKMYFEIKYTEQEFSKKCGATDAHNRWLTIYDKMVKNNQAFKDKSQEFFYQEYQINRNLAYIQSKSDYVIFLIPKYNENLTQQLLRRKVDKITNAKILYWEDAVEYIKNTICGNVHSQYYQTFEDKYLPKNLPDVLGLNQEPN